MLIHELTLVQEVNLLITLNEAMRYNEYVGKNAKLDIKIATFCMDFYHNNTEHLIANNKDLDLQTIEIMQFYIFSFSEILAHFNALYPYIPKYIKFVDLIKLIKSVNSNNLKIRLIANKNARQTHYLLVDFINNEIRRDIRQKIECIF